MKKYSDLFPEQCETGLNISAAVVGSHLSESAIATWL